MGQTTATLHRASRPVTQLDLLNAATASRSRSGRHGGAATSVIGGTELLMSPGAVPRPRLRPSERGADLGLPSDRKALDSALAANGLVRQRRPDPALVGSAQPRQHAVDGRREAPSSASSPTPAAGNSITPEAGVARRVHLPLLVADRRRLDQHATATRSSIPALQAALAEMQARGFGGFIDLANTNSYGGCYGAREVPLERRHDGRLGRAGTPGAWPST